MKTRKSRGPITVLEELLMLLLQMIRASRSCESQLLIIISDIAKSMNAGEQMDTILLDFSKAFDKVPHQRLLLKLRHYGIRGNLLFDVCPDVA
jgi:hypothetical protein